MHEKIFELSLVKTYLLNTRTRHLEFKLINNTPINFKPGQFISLNFKKNAEVVRRNFSIANVPDIFSTTIEIAATFVPNGLASTNLWNMQPGDTITASGPFGIFVLKPEDLITTKRYILVATGTGVTPYRAMLRQLNQILEQHNITIILLFGVRDPKELIYGDEFINFSKQQSKFKFIACYSRYKPIDPNSLQTHEKLGYVQDQLITLNINPKEDLAYLCGNPNMVDASLASLESLGLHKHKIRREKYISNY